MPAFAPVTIAGLSKASGIDADVISDYLARGPVPPPRRRRGRSVGFAFHREHLDRLRFITRGLALGFSLDAIGELLGIDGSYRTCGDVYGMAQRTLAATRTSEIAPSSTLEALAAACPRRGGQPTVQSLPNCAGPLNDVRPVNRPRSDPSSIESSSF
jgi:DNA-binding transcriptional MerR regulator